MSIAGDQPGGLGRERPISAEFLERLAEFSDTWNGKIGNEQQLAQPFLLALCEALGVAKPYEAGSSSVDQYGFERWVQVPQSAAKGRIDMYKADHFVLEAKCGRSSAKEPGTGPVRDTKGYWDYIRNAYLDQAKVYAGLLPEGPPPLVIVVDVGWRFWIWRHTEGRYEAFHSPHRLDIPLADLATEENARTLLACFEDPDSLDPTKHQARITREVAGSIAPLASQLEQAGHDATDVARFLMRCLFCMFAEDVELLPAGHFSKLLEHGRKNSQFFRAQVESLFANMNEGGEYDWASIRRFNGALFKDSRGIDLSAEQIRFLADAAALDWADVDPAIFGTLLERALDASERHRLGAHYTPRAFVMRLAKLTLDRPLRHDWELVQAQVQEVLGAAADTPAGRAKAQNAAITLIEGYLHKLRKVRVLDPACGTGNFLYVSYEILKELEHEALTEIASIDAAQEGLAIEGASVLPSQLLGIEVKPWAAEIAQLVIWIGHLQWTLRHRGAKWIDEPVLSDRRTIECRDALINWSSTSERLDEAGQPALHWDGRTFKSHAVSGKEVPDETALVPILDYQGVELAEWPEADFVLGNPPFIGNKHMREHLGDGYTEAVRNAFAKVPNTVDFVMYWWQHAAELARTSQIRAFGLITTNSLRQTQNRQIPDAALSSDPPLRLAAAIADHPWMDEGADVRIAMSVGQPCVSGAAPSLLGTVTKESKDHGEVDVAWKVVPEIHPDLSGDVDVSSAVPLNANQGVSFQGMNLVGKGFRLAREDLGDLGYTEGDPPAIVRPYLNGREFMQKRQYRYVIDAYDYTADELHDAHPPAYQWLYDRVKPERDHNRRPGYRNRWWQFGEARGRLRVALAGLNRYIATPETSRHRVFRFFDVSVCPDHKLYAIALQEPYFLGVLSSRVHAVWAVRLGGRQGVGNDPTYNNTRCFLTFPFPEPTEAQRERIGDLATTIDRWRSKAREEREDATITAMYNILGKLRVGEALSPTQSSLHSRIGTSHLLELHDHLDRAVVAAYGWSDAITDEQLIAQLLDLNHERAKEEASGLVRYLRPDIEGAEGAAELPLPDSRDEVVAPSPRWPTAREPFEQLEAVLSVVRASPGPVGVDEVSAEFTRARKNRVRQILDLLAQQRIIVDVGEGRFTAPT